MTIARPTFNDGRGLRRRRGDREDGHLAVRKDRDGERRRMFEEEREDHADGVNFR